jgi:hypothetical protein
MLEGVKKNKVGGRVELGLGFVRLGLTTRFCKPQSGFGLAGRAKSCLEAYIINQPT